jgi:hypothetical protein
MVLATETTMPTTAPCRRGHPSRAATPSPIETENTMPSEPPGSATHLTPRRSRRENSMPIENISRITPISANGSNARRSETQGPG